MDFENLEFRELSGKEKCLLRDISKELVRRYEMHDYLLEEDVEEVLGKFLRTHYLFMRKNSVVVEFMNNEEPILIDNTDDDNANLSEFVGMLTHLTEDKNFNESIRSKYDTFVDECVEGITRDEVEEMIRNKEFPDSLVYKDAETNKWKAVYVGSFHEEEFDTQRQALEFLREAQILNETQNGEVIK